MADAERLNAEAHVAEVETDGPRVARAAGDGSRRPVVGRLEIRERITAAAISRTRSIRNCEAKECKIHQAMKLPYVRQSPVGSMSSFFAASVAAIVAVHLTARI